MLKRIKNLTTIEKVIILAIIVILLASVFSGKGAFDDCLADGYSKTECRMMLTQHNNPVIVNYGR